MIEKDQVVEVLNGSYAVVRCSPTRSIIELTWKGYAPSKQFREILEVALDAVEVHGLRLWKADLREMAAILRQDEHWTVTDWFPRLASAGLQRMAILMSTDLFNHMSVERIMGAAAPVLGFEVAYFDDVLKAEQWLFSS